MAHSHLNGPVNLDGAEEVFRTVSSICGETVSRIPDGRPDAGAAVESYKIFKRLRDEEEAVLPGTRFQVSLVSGGAPDDLETILGAIAHEDLAIQWDLPIENVNPRALAVLSRRVPHGVPFGYRLRCRGVGDMGPLVTVANAIAEHSTAPPAWVSLPVPRGRDDDAFYSPLDDLRLAPETHPYLGLVHEDGLAATQARIAPAKRHLRRFGVAAGCGMGEVPRATVLKLLWLQLGAVV